MKLHFRVVLGFYCFSHIGCCKSKNKHSVLYSNFVNHDCVRISVVDLKWLSLLLLWSFLLVVDIPSDVLILFNNGCLFTNNNSLGGSFGLKYFLLSW